MLDGAQHGVEEQHREDDHGTLPLAGNQGDQGSHHQDDHQQVLELFEEYLYPGFFLPIRQGVFAVALQALRGLGVREAARPAVQVLQRLMDRLVEIALFHSDTLPFPFYHVQSGNKKDF